jgi:hypothetical protein
MAVEMIRGTARSMGLKVENKWSLQKIKKI